MSKNLCVVDTVLNPRKAVTQTVINLIFYFILKFQSI